MSEEPRSERPPTADVNEAHWVVVSPIRNKMIVKRGLYRHKSQELAEAEAQRLARLNPGRMFIVYAAGARFEVETPVTAEPAAPVGAERTRALTPVPAVPA
jgi:hypothetical protein